MFFRRVFLLIVAALMLPLTLAVAQQPAATGVIEGRVFNAASGTYLNNARVTVEGTDLQVFTGDDGSFQLRAVPAGRAAIRVRYLGQSDILETVAVEADAVAKVNFTFNAADTSAEGKTVMLDKFVVEAKRFRNAQELALNEERTSTNIKSVVALDSLGYVSDGNIGEFVKFLPGVDVGYGSTSDSSSNPDNAVSVGVRGFDSASTAILVDGVPLASSSAGSLTRSVQLDVVSINNASRLEIIKVATPDMPQDSPGGSINLITRGAFELPKATYNLSVAFNGNTNALDFKKTPGPYEPSYKIRPSIRLGASIPLTKTLGISFSAATDNKYSLTRNSGMRDWFYTARTATINGVVTPVTNANGGIGIHNPVVDRYELSENQWIDSTQSGSVRVDWRPFSGLEIRANGQISTSENTGVFRRTQWRFANATGIKDWGEDYVTGYQRTSTFNPGHNAQMAIDARDKEGFTTQGYISAKYRKNLWAIDARASASESYSNTPDTKNGHFSTVDVTISPGRMDFIDIDRGVVGEIRLWDINGAPMDYGRLSSWNRFTSSGGTVRSSEVNSRDLLKQYNLDISRELGFLPFPLTLKAGGQLKEKSNHKWGRGATYRMNYTGPNVENSALESPYASEAVNGYAFQQYWPDPSKVYDLYVSNPAAFDDQLVSPTLNIDNRAWNYASRVGNTKGLTITDTDVYGMATARLFKNRMTIVTGARQSRKDNKGYNVFNDPQFNYVKMKDGTLYRDSIYTAGVKYDGSANGTFARDVVLTDLALRARMTAAGVRYLPTQLELAPNGIANGNRENNFHFAPLGRYTRNIDSSVTQPWQPQIQVAYDVTEALRVQIAWSKETRLPDLEAADGLIVNGASFQINEAANPTSDLGGDGSINIANVRGLPEINQSYNAKVAYYSKSGGRYSISYYHKVVNNVWETFETYNTDADYDILLQSMGVDRESYPNYRITTTLPGENKAIRKGFEIELAQNLGLLGGWAKGFDTFLTYTRRPVVASTGGEARLGWISQLPVRAKWTGGLSFSARRFSAQATATYVENGITYSGSGTSVTMPDGTTQVVQLYNLNKIPPDVKLQTNYVINKNFTVFAVANRVFGESLYSQISDAQTGYMPDYATHRNKRNQGITFSAGVRAQF